MNISLLRRIGNDVEELRNEIAQILEDNNCIEEDLPEAEQKRISVIAERIRELKNMCASY